MTAKYVITKSGNAIVFTMAMSHSDFKHLNIRSAGFVSFYSMEDGSVDCECTGLSESLGVKSDPTDKTYIKAQIIKQYY